MLYFTRHGQTEANAREIFNLPTDSLTGVGVEQAHTVAKKAAELGITRIISSPLERARQTAEIIAEDLGLNALCIVYDSNLAERSVGVLEGAPYNGMTTATISDSTEGAESSQQAFNRAKLLLEDYLRVSDPTLLVGHAGIYRFLVVALRNGNLNEVPHVPRFAQGEIVNLSK